MFILHELVFRLWLYAVSLHPLTFLFRKMGNQGNNLKALLLLVGWRSNRAFFFVVGWGTPCVEIGIPCVEIGLFCGGEGFSCGQAISLFLLEGIAYREV